MAPDDLPALEPVADDGVLVMTVGTALWAVAGAACLLLRDQLAANGNEWWIATCWTGVALGLLGLAYTRRRARVYREHRAAVPEAPGATAR